MYAWQVSLIEWEPTEKFDEVLVVRNNNELESARATRMNDIGQRLRQTLDVLTETGGKQRFS